MLFTHFFKSFFVAYLLEISMQLSSKSSLIYFSSSNTFRAKELKHHRLRLRSLRMVDGLIVNSMYMQKTNWNNTYIISEGGNNECHEMYGFNFVPQTCAFCQCNVETMRLMLNRVAKIIVNKYSYCASLNILWGEFSSPSDSTEYTLGFSF